MTSPKQLGHRAGFLYLLVIIFGVFAELYVRANLIVPGDAAATAQRILAHPLLFRWGFLSDLLMQLAFFFLALVLYRLFLPVDRHYAVGMLLSVVVSVAIMVLNMLHQYAALLLLERSGFAEALPPEQVREWAAFFLELHRYGYRIAQLFFGLWLYPLGQLAYRSGYVPRLIGVLLIIACGSFLLDFGLFFLLPEYPAAVSARVTLPTTIGEFAMCGWLLIRGVRPVSYL
jgi:hypothetical protein